MEARPKAMSEIYRTTPPVQVTDSESPARLREIIRELETSRGALGVRVEIIMDVQRPKVIITASSEAAEERIAQQLAPYVVGAINDTFGELVRAATKEPRP